MRANRKNQPDADFIADAQKYAKRSDWEKSSPMYQQVMLFRRHLIEACTAHMGPPRQKLGHKRRCFRYTLEAVTKLAIKCTTKAEFKKKYPGAYTWSYRASKMRELEALCNWSTAPQRQVIHSKRYLAFNWRI